MQQHHFLPVNWTDGMKINQSHFLAQDNANVYQIAQSTSSLLHDCNYGLLPGVGNGETGMKLFLSVDNQQQVQLRVQQCKAITRGGYLISHEEDTALHSNNLLTPLLQLSVPFQELKGRASQYYAVLSVNPFQRKPFGAVDPAEYPPRLPYTTPLLTLGLLADQEVTNQSLGLYQLPVGRLKIEEQRVLLDETYIPPCASVSSHFELLEIHAGLEQFYTKMERYALQIIQKILQRKQTNEMAAIAQRLCESVTIFTAQHLAEIKTVSVHQPPVFLINKVSALARLFKNTLDHYIGSGKEELINYCTEWCNVSQGELEGCISDLANHQYRHLDLNSSVEKLAVFTKVISGLFVNLAKLEYIGKRRDAGIFVKEIIVNPQPETPVKTRRSFLAE